MSCLHCPLHERLHTSCGPLALYRHSSHATLIIRLKALPGPSLLYLHEGHWDLVSPGSLYLQQANSIPRLIDQRVSLLICRNKQKQHFKPDLSGMLPLQLRCLVNSYSPFKTQIRYHLLRKACHVHPQLAWFSCFTASSTWVLGHSSGILSELCLVIKP